MSSRLEEEPNALAALAAKEGLTEKEVMDIEKAQEDEEEENSNGEDEEEEEEEEEDGDTGKMTWGHFSQRPNPLTSPPPPPPSSPSAGGRERFVLLPPAVLPVQVHPDEAPSPPDPLPPPAADAQERRRHPQRAPAGAQVRAGGDPRARTPARVRPPGLRQRTNLQGRGQVGREKKWMIVLITDAVMIQSLIIFFSPYVVSKVSWTREKPACVALVARGTLPQLRGRGPRALVSSSRHLEGNGRSENVWNLAPGS